MKCKSIIWIIAIIFGVALLIFGIVLWFIIPVIVKEKLNAFLPLTKKTVVYDEWLNTSMPIYMQFWYFTITNPAEVEKRGKPVLAQVGPYTYREYRVKGNVSFYDNGTVSYRQRRIFHFDRNQSVGDENDIITTVSIPLLLIGDKIRDSGILKKIINRIVSDLGDPDVLIRVSVGNITWGYVDPVLKMVSEIARLFKIKIDPTVGLFYGKNDTDDGEYLVNSGSLSLTDFLFVRKWRGEDHLSFWGSKSANMLNGTDGSMFAPSVTDSVVDSATHKLYVFQSDICRSIYATHTSSPSVRGVAGYQYTPPYAVFANSTENPDNIGFCVDGDCLGSGVLNMSSCVPLAGNIIVMSQPHLYQAAEKYQVAVAGLTPSPDCVTSLTIEPVTGLPLNLQKKLQINVAVAPVLDFVHMDNLRNLLLPVVWINESMLIDPSMAEMILAMLERPVTAARACSIALMVIGPVVAVVLLIAMIMYLRRTQYTSMSVNDKDACT